VDQIETLLAGLRAGDKAAQRTLFERYYDAVLRRTIRVVGSEADAHDLVTTLFVDFIDRLHQGFRGQRPGALHAYLETAAISRGVRFMKRRRIVTLALDAETAEGEQDATMPDSLLQALLDRCLAKLSPRLRRLVALKFGQDKDNLEIAELLGVSRAAVSQGLVRDPDGALPRLKRCVESGMAGRS
jgi:RNA polymerase sigma factor (sigma-70 family)